MPARSPGNQRPGRHRIERDLPDVVAIVEYRQPHALEAQHVLDMFGHGPGRGAAVPGRVARAPSRPIVPPSNLGQVAVDRVVRGRLIGQGVRANCRFEQGVQHIDDVAEERTEIGLAFFLAVSNRRERLVQASALGRPRSRFQAFGDAALTAFHPPACETRHGGPPGLRSAMPPETGREYPLPLTLSSKMAPAISAKVS